MSHTYLIINERIFVVRSLGSGWSIRRIADVLGIAPSIISREIAQCREKYDSNEAQNDCELKRQRCMDERKLESCDNARYIMKFICNIDELIFFRR